MAEDKTSIDIMEDGPFIVDNLQVLENSRAQKIESKKKIVLCRCGASENKPFCDGTHSKVGFSGKREAKIKLDKEKEYDGKGISVFYNAVLCYHAAQCVGNLPAVFDVNSKPWINPDNSDKESIMSTIKKCPSGALSYKLGDEHIRDFNGEQKIRIEKDGPYRVSGNIELKIEEELQPPSKKHFALCRCGASKNKPYCDGSHSNIGFSDDDN
jgi:CDGSH-type Zn-finger protein